MLGVLAHQQVLAGKAEEGGWATKVELSPERGPSGSGERHHIASSECLWGYVRHYHVGSLLVGDSRYQIDSAFEGEQAALQVGPLIETSPRGGTKVTLSDPQMVTPVEI